MSFFKASNTVTNEIIEYESDSINSVHLQEPWKVEEIVILTLPEGEEPVVDTRLFGGRRRITKLELMELMGETAYKTIFTYSKSSIDIEVWIKLMEWATPDTDGTSIDLDDTRTIAGITSLGTTLESQNIVTSGWAEKVLNG